MNKILHLAYESGLYAQGTPDSWDEEALEKFGKLIIEQCIEQSGKYLGPTDKYHAAKNIRTYFGVSND